MIRSYRCLIEWVDRPSLLTWLAIAFVASWAIFFSQISTLDHVPPDYVDKCIHCLHALGHTLTMDKLRSLFPWLVAVQVAGVVLFALRIVPLVCIPLVVLPLFWGRLVGVCPW